MLLYRESAALVPATELSLEIEGLLREGGDSAALGALLKAGELESALMDAQHRSAELAMALSDNLASAWLAGESTSTPEALARIASFAELPRLRTVRPEGYAFYALDPTAYVELAGEHAQRSRRAAVVIGIRSIGTSLSALVKAALLEAKIPTLRITVRPNGHPWDRKLRLSPEEQTRILERAGSSDFIVVDEGPGLSGSTFLAVGEALAELGVPSSNIVFFGSAPLETERLKARNASERYSRFCFRRARSLRTPEPSLDLSGGAWRAQVYADESEFPACWPAQERLKYLTLDRRTLLKFSGFRPYDREIRQRAEHLALAGWAPQVSSGPPGFLAYEWHSGPVAELVRDHGAMLGTIASYLAFRCQAFPELECSTEPLTQMARVNLAEALNLELPREFELELRRPVAADSRLLPHEWRLREGGRALKTDAAEHADDHLFPGPVDIAWDLAGAIVEWGLSPAETSFLLDEFRRLTADDASRRVRSYLVAYCAFRVAYAEYARSSEEGARWESALSGYRSRLAQAVRELL